MEFINKFLAGVKSGRDAVRTLGGQQAHYVVTLSGANVTIDAAWRGCRWVECEVAGIVRVAYTRDNDVAVIETKSLAAGEKWFIQDVQTVYYQYGTSPASCDTQVYNDAGDLVTGIKLKY